MGWNQVKEKMSQENIPRIVPLSGWDEGPSNKKTQKYDLYWDGMGAHPFNTNHKERYYPVPSFDFWKTSNPTQSSDLHTNWSPLCDRMSIPFVLELGVCGIDWGCKEILGEIGMVWE